MSYLRPVFLPNKNKKATEKIRKLLSNPEFDIWIEEIKIKYRFYQNEKQNNLSATDMAFYCSGIESFQIDLKHMYKRFGLDIGWEYFILQYLGTGKPYKEFNPALNALYLDDENQTTYLKLNLETTLQDIKDSWRDIQKIMTDRKKSKIKLSKNLDRDKAIYQARLKKIPYKKIMVEIKEKYGLLDIGHLKKINSTFRKKIKGYS
jgi:hypothetical protein